MSLDIGSRPSVNSASGIASPRCDYTNTIGTVTFAAGETSKSFSVAIIDDSYAEGTESFTVSLNNPSGATLGSQSTTTVMIVDNETTTGPNPIDNTNFFVRQQYLDFLGREPDEAGFNFWVNNLQSCGGNAGCLDAKRRDTSAAFFFSIEFQNTGFLVYRMYQAAYGSGDLIGTPAPLTRAEFLPATRALAANVVVNQGNWPGR